MPRYKKKCKFIDVRELITILNRIQKKNSEQSIHATDVLKKRQDWLFDNRNNYNLPKHPLEQSSTTYLTNIT